MASTDAIPIPRKNVAYRLVFVLIDADGDPVTSAAGLDSEVSKDQGAFSDCTNEAAEIGNGWYYIDLTSTEMNADHVAYVCKTSTSGAKQANVSIYPAEDADLRANVVAYGGTAGTFSSGRPEVNTTHFGGSALTQSGGRPEVNTTHAAGTAWGSGAITAASIASNAITSAKIATDAIGASQIADNAIDAGAIASNAITAAKIATGAITNAKFASGAIDAAAIADGAIDAGAIATGAIDADALATDAVSEIATGVWGFVTEGTRTAVQIMRGLSAYALGKLSGGATATNTFRDIDDTKDRITATVDQDGNRTAITLDLS